MDLKEALNIWDGERYGVLRQDGEAMRTIIAAARNQLAQIVVEKPKLPSLRSLEQQMRECVHAHGNHYAAAAILKAVDELRPHMREVNAPDSKFWMGWFRQFCKSVAEVVDLQ